LSTLGRELSDCYLRAVRRHVKDAPEYALLDYPDHTNVGDAAIFLGELAALGQFGVGTPNYVGTFASRLEDIAAFCPEGPLLLHGGGNFGDLWPRHQDYRIAILERYKHRRIVQLPQSVHFLKQGIKDQTARAIAAHGDFHLMVRDRTSLELARRSFDCDVELVPDAAHALSVTTSGAADEVVTIARRDKERQGIDIGRAMAPFGPVEDWPETREARTQASRGLIDVLRTMIPFGRQQAMEARVRRFIGSAEDRFAGGIALLERGEIIVSDRLHVHILCELAQKPHYVLDNNYGKLGAYIDTWGASSNTRRVSSIDELVGLIRSL